MIAIFSMRCRNLLQYRIAAIAGFGTQLFFGMMKVMVFTALYESTNQPQPFTLEEVVTYIWLAQALLLLVPWRGDSNVEAMIRNGSIVYELARPVQLYWLWFSRALAQRIIPVFLRCLPMVPIAFLFLGLQTPMSPLSFLGFLVSLQAAILLSSAFTVLLNAFLFWTISGEGFSRIMPVIIILSSGQLIPLPFFPDNLQYILNILPFRGLLDIPIRIYMGDFPNHMIPNLLIHQFIWFFAIILLTQGMIQLGLRRLVIHGG